MAKRKVKTKKITKILFGVILIVAILAGGSFYYIYNFSKKKPEPQVVEKKEEVKKEPKDYTAKVFMVGDALIHDCVYTDAKRQGNGSYDFKPMIENIKSISSKYD